MTTRTHRKTIAAAAVIGALAIAAPASASVLEPVSTSNYSTSADQQQAAQVQTVNATYQPPSDQSSPAQVQTVNATYQPPSDQSQAAETSLNAIVHPVNPPSDQVLTANSSHPFSGQGGQQLALRRDGSQAEAFVADVSSPPATSGDGFDWGDAAIGAGAALLAAAFLMMGAGASRRTSSRPKPGGAVSQGA
jgi:hypothetical protein